MESTFRESLRGIYCHMPEITDSNLEEVRVYLQELLATPYNEIALPVVSMINLLHMQVFADWGETPWASKVRVLKTYYEQCSAEDLQRGETVILQELLDYTLEVDLIPSINSLESVAPILTEPPTTPPKVKAPRKIPENTPQNKEVFPEPETIPAPNSGSLSSNYPTIPIPKIH